MEGYVSTSLLNILSTKCINASTAPLVVHILPSFLHMQLVISWRKIQCMMYFVNFLKSKINITGE